MQSFRNSASRIQDYEDGRPIYTNVLKSLYLFHGGFKARSCPAACMGDPITCGIGGILKLTIHPAALIPNS